VASRAGKRPKKAPHKPFFAGWARQSLEPRGLVWAVGCLLLAALVGRFDGTFWLGLMVNELAFQLSLVALSVGAFAGWRRAWIALTACGALASWWGLPAASLARSTRPTPTTGPTLRVLAAHLGAPNLEPAALLTELVSHKVDVALLSADDAATLATLEGAPNLRNYRVLHGSADAAPWALFVRSELSVNPRARAGKGGAAHAELRVNQCTLRVQPLSVPSLFSYGARGLRAQRLRALQKQPGDARGIWLGHLGSSPDAADVRGLVEAQDLRDGRTGYGRMSSSPAALGMLGVPNEQLLIRGWLRVTAMEMDAPLAAQAQRTLRATLEFTEPACRGRP